ncbi:hypothetical protein ACQUEU_00670 [Enterococcus casseliflavus]|uniref:hypothetical protein n=1 Tax=Enterococcus casseliflavus TaxID=37734 RepID=UPI003D0BADB7
MDFNEAKQKKERGMTVRETLENALKVSSETESIVIVRKMKNGDVPTSFSWEGSLEALGMLEVAKADIVEYMAT